MNSLLHKYIVPVQYTAQGLIRLVNPIEAVIEDVCHRHLVGWDACSLRESSAQVKHSARFRNNQTVLCGFGCGIQ